MPKAIKKRITKKAGLKEEEVRGFAIHVLDFFRDKKNVVVFIVVAVSIAIILTATTMIYFSSVKKKAYSFESEAYNYYYNIGAINSLSEDERWGKSLELFHKAIEIKPTPTAQFYLGNCYFNLGDYDNALKAYNKFIEKYKGEEYLLFPVYQKVASIYSREGRSNEFIRTLRSLAQLRNGSFKDTALILEARYYESAAKHEEAVKTYKEIVKDFPTSPWIPEAKAKIEREEMKEDNVSSEQDKSVPDDLPGISTK